MQNYLLGELKILYYGDEHIQGTAFVCNDSHALTALHGLSSTLTYI